jgi:hypothetical protein
LCDGQDDGDDFDGFNALSDFLFDYTQHTVNISIQLTTPIGSSDSGHLH